MPRSATGSSPAGWRGRAQSAGDTREKFPRFQVGNFAANRQRVADLEALARDRGATAAQVALAWLLARGDHVFPIPGCKSRRHLDQNLDAADIRLSADELAALDGIFPKGAAAGDRYPATGMTRVNL